jgi:hypothetical protein
VTADNGFVFEQLDDWEKNKDVHRASLALGTLQIEFDVESGQLLHVWGYSPRASWRPANFGQPNVQPGVVKVLIEKHSVMRGVSLTLDHHNDPRVEYSASTGWVRVASKEDKPSSHVLEFASGCGITLDSEGVIKALWVLPRMT